MVLRIVIDVAAYIHDIPKRSIDHYVRHSLLPARKIQFVSALVHQRSIHRRELHRKSDPGKDLAAARLLDRWSGAGPYDLLPCCRAHHRKIIHRDIRRSTGARLRSHFRRIFILLSLFECGRQIVPIRVLPSIGDLDICIIHFMEHFGAVTDAIRIYPRVRNSHFQFDDLIRSIDSRRKSRHCLRRIKPASGMKATHISAAKTIETNLFIAKPPFGGPGIQPLPGKQKSRNALWQTHLSHTFRLKLIRLLCTVYHT